MKYKIVSDSASNVRTMGEAPFSVAPLHIIVGERDFTDDESLDLEQLEKALAGGGKSSTACPGVGDWLEAFGDAEAVFGVTITSALSGSWAAASAAKEEYEQSFPSRHVHIVDSLSAGPEMALLLEKLKELIEQGKEEAEIVREIQAYAGRTHLLFCLESLQNLANNGRCHPAVAKIAGLLGIRVVGRASREGTLEVLHKCRGEQGALSRLVRSMKEAGYCGGRAYILHYKNQEAAKKLAAMIRDTFAGAEPQVFPTWGLCSYYAEKGGLMLGFEA